MTILKSFEKPLTPEEELKYLTKFKEEQDEHAKEVLIERNMRLVAHIAKKYNNSSEDQDDLISIGTIGLIKAIETYNIEKGTRLATYASKCIENEILMNIRTNKKNKVQVSLQDPIGMDIFAVVFPDEVQAVNFTGKFLHRCVSGSKTAEVR